MRWLLACGPVKSPRGRLAGHRKSPPKWTDSVSWQAVAVLCSACRSARVNSQRHESTARTRHWLGTSKLSMASVIGKPLVTYPRSGSSIVAAERDGTHEL